MAICRALRLSILTLVGLLWSLAAFGAYFQGQTYSISQPAVSLSPGTGYAGTSGGLAAVESFANAETQAVTATASGTGGAVAVSVADGGGFPASAVCFARLIGGTIEGNGLWPCTASSGTITLLGSTFANAWTSGGTIAYVRGGQLVSGAVTSTQFSGGITLTIGSTANMATGDTFTVGAVGGTVEANGRWQIIRWADISGHASDTTHLELCLTVGGGSGSAYTCNYPPQFVNAYVSGGAIGDQEPVIGNFIHEYDGAIIETAGYTISLNGQAGGGNRGYLSSIVCYMEPSGATGVATLAGPGVNTFKALAPMIANGATQEAAYGSITSWPNGVQAPPAPASVWGWNVPISVGPANQDGPVTLACDMRPTNGLTRRVAINLWLNLNGATGYVNRLTTTPIYVSTGASAPGSGGVVGRDPAGTRDGATTITATGPAPSGVLPQTISFSAAPGISASGQIIGMCAASCGASDYLTAEQTTASTATGTNTFAYVWGSGLPANLTGQSIDWTNSRGCGTSPGTAGHPGSFTNPYRSMFLALQCTAQIGGYIIFADTSAPYKELPDINGTAEPSTHLVEVLPCAPPWTSATSCASQVGSQAIPVQLQADFRFLGGGQQFQNEASLFTNVVIDTFSFDQLDTVLTTGSSWNWATGYPVYEVMFRNAQWLDSNVPDFLADTGPAADANANWSTSGPGYYSNGLPNSINVEPLIGLLEGNGAQTPTLANPPRRYGLLDAYVNSYTTSTFAVAANIISGTSGGVMYTPMIFGTAPNAAWVNVNAAEQQNLSNCTGSPTACDYFIATNRVNFEPWTQTNAPYPLAYQASANVIPANQYATICGTASGSNPCLDGVIQTTATFTSGSATVTVASATSIAIGQEALAAAIPKNCLVAGSYSSGSTTVPLTPSTSVASPPANCNATFTSAAPNPTISPITFATVNAYTGPVWDATNSVLIVPFNTNEASAQIADDAFTDFAGSGSMVSAGGQGVYLCYVAAPTTTDCPTSGSAPGGVGAFAYIPGCGMLNREITTFNQCEWVTTPISTAESPFTEFAILNGTIASVAACSSNPTACYALGDSVLLWEQAHQNGIKAINGPFAAGSPTVDQNDYIQQFQSNGARQELFWQTGQFAGSNTGLTFTSGSTSMTVTGGSAWAVGDTLVWCPVSCTAAPTYGQARLVTGVSSSSSPYSLTIDSPFTCPNITLGACSGATAGLSSLAASVTNGAYIHGQNFWNFACVACGQTQSANISGLQSQFQYTAENNLWIDNDIWLQSVAVLNSAGNYPHAMLDSAMLDSVVWQIGLGGGGDEQLLSQVGGWAWDNNTYCNQTSPSGQCTAVAGTLSQAQYPGSNFITANPALDTLLATSTLKPTGGTVTQVDRGIQGSSVFANGTPLFGETLDGRLIGPGTSYTSPVVGAQQP